MSSRPVEKFKNGKKSKLKYHKLDINQKTNHTTSFEKFENVNVVWKKEAGEKAFSEFVNFNDFPELKLPQNYNKKSTYKSDNSEPKRTNSQLPVLSGNKQKSVENFPALSVTKNSKTGERNFMKNNEKSAAINSESNSLAFSQANTKVLEFKLDAFTDVNTNKQSSVRVLNKSSTQPAKNFVKKKRTDPVCINFQDFLNVNKIKNKRKQEKIFKTKLHRLRHHELLSGNFLDSSNPVRSRGKHREIKKKKLSPFKTAIIKERILKQKIREIAKDAHLGNDCFNLINKIDFSTEIKAYLNELNSRKLNNSNSIKSKVKDNTQPKSNNENQENMESKLAKKEESSENVSYFMKKEIPQITPEGEIKFSSKFREYCDNVITPSLNSAVSELIKELIKHQDNVFLRDPIKAKMRKRHVSGIREVKKYLNLKKVKMVIIAPNLEKLQMEGGVYDLISQLKSIANSQNVPYGFALNRYKLGTCTRKNVPVSAFAVLSYEGVEALYKNALHELEEAKKKFAEVAKPDSVSQKTNTVNSQVISTLISAFRQDLQISNEVEPD